MLDAVSATAGGTRETKSPDVTPRKQARMMMAAIERTASRHGASSAHIAVKTEMALILLMYPATKLNESEGEC